MSTAHPETRLPAPALTRIRPSQGLPRFELAELWRYRELLAFLTWRDIKVRYKQTLIGAAWAVLQPLLMMVVFTMFFGRLAQVPSGGIPYPLFVFAGLLPWTFFATAVANAGNSVVGSEKLITKVYFPRLMIPLSSVAAATVDLLMASGVLLLMILWHGVPLSGGLLLAPLVVLLIAAVATGVGTFLAALNVSYRDFRYVLPFLVQLWLFATPSVYMQVDWSANEAATNRLPAVAVWLCQLNPLTTLVDAFRACMLDRPIDWVQLGWASAMAAIALLVGSIYFRKVEDHFADVI